jgi:hypothetical protein
MDWIGAAINVIGWYIMPKNRLAATCIFLIGNIFWISWGIGHSTWSIIVLQGFFVLLNIRAVLIWQGSLNLLRWNFYKKLILIPAMCNQNSFIFNANENLDSF